MAYTSQARSWDRSELDQINATDMDIERINNLLRNISLSMENTINPKDVRKLRDLKLYFEKELKKRSFKTL